MTGDEEYLADLTQAGLLTPKVLEVMRDAAPGVPDIVLLERAGYRYDTAYDGHLRAILGTRQWARYARDSARIVCAAAITDGAAAGYDMPAVLTRALAQRPRESDPALAITRQIATELADVAARRAAGNTATLPPVVARALSRARAPVHRKPETATVRAVIPVFGTRPARTQSGQRDA